MPDSQLSQLIIKHQWVTQHVTHLRRASMKVPVDLVLYTKRVDCCLSSWYEKFSVDSKGWNEINERYQFEFRLVNLAFQFEIHLWDWISLALFTYFALHPNHFDISNG